MQVDRQRTYYFIVYLFFLLNDSLNIGRRVTRNLTKPRRRRQRERQAIGLMSKTTTLHVHHAFLYISLPSLHNYDQILSFLGNGNGKARNSTMSV